MRYRPLHDPALAGITANGSGMLAGKGQIWNGGMRAWVMRVVT